jgi:hypothetical protein
VEHAPTVAQCQADQKLWLAELEDNRVRDVKYFALADWKIEMRKCESADSENRRKYETTESEVLAAQASRQSDFIDRHGLFHQFIVEDEEGKR